MSQNEPETLGELWRMIERDSQSTRGALSDLRDQVKRELDDVRARLESYVTRDHFDAEKRLLEARIVQAENALQRMEEKDREEARARTRGRRELLYKGVIPVLSMLVAITAIFVGYVTSQN